MQHLTHLQDEEKAACPKKLYIDDGADDQTPQFSKGLLSNLLVSEAAESVGYATAVCCYSQTV